MQMSKTPDSRDPSGRANRIQGTKTSPVAIEKLFLSWTGGHISCTTCKLCSTIIVSCVLALLASLIVFKAFLYAASGGGFPPHIFNST